MKGKGLGKTLKRLSRGAKKLSRSKLGKRVRKGILKVAKDVAVEMLKSGGDTKSLSTVAKRSALSEGRAIASGNGRMMPFRRDARAVRKGVKALRSMRK